MKSLQEIGLKHGSDRSINLIGTKTYHDYYEPIFKLKQIKTALELGVYYGNGLVTLREYLPDTELIGIDMSLECCNRQINNCSLYQSSQTDATRLNQILSKHNPLDLVIDDASHEVDKSIESFNIIFPYVSSQGIYIIEDLQCFDTKHNKQIISDFTYNNGVNVKYNEKDFDTLLNFINKLSDNTISKRAYQEIKITNNSLIIIKI
jgi:cephalosporin hydroxylase